MPPLSSSDPWGALHVSLLPLFNGESLRESIEELNQYVKQHISAVVSASPSKSMLTLENDTIELLSSGMITLNAKLNGVEDDKLVGRVVDRWGFFWDQVLTYVEAVLLPLQNDPLLSTLYRAPKRPSSPRRQATKGSISGLNNALAPSIDVRTLALRSFRDKVILPLSERLYARLAICIKQEDNPEFPSRLQQMLLVLSAQSRPRPVSLTAPPPQLPLGETAINDLLRILRSPRNVSRSQAHSKGLKSNVRGVKTQSFLSGGVPRDRRGRLALKAKTQTNDDPNGTERERDRKFLEALKSPDIDATNRVNATGWGALVAGEEREDKGKDKEGDEKMTNWEQATAHAALEGMIGLEQAAVAQGAPNRRRMT